jgi:hypothetical protein
MLVSLGELLTFTTPTPTPTPEVVNHTEDALRYLLNDNSTTVPGHPDRFIYLFLYMHIAFVGFVTCVGWPCDCTFYA